MASVSHCYSLQWQEGSNALVCLISHKEKQNHRLQSARSDLFLMCKPGIFWQRENPFEQQLEASDVPLKSSFVPLLIVSSFFLSLLFCCLFHAESRQCHQIYIGDVLLLVLLGSLCIKHIQMHSIYTSTWTGCLFTHHPLISIIVNIWIVSHDVEQENYKANKQIQKKLLFIACMSTKY